MEKVIVSVVGEDRPGIVAAISKVLFDLACNIENVSQTILQTVFGGIFIVAASEQVTDDLLTDTLTRALTGFDVNVSVKRCGAGISRQHPRRDDAPFVITTVGPDRLGLVAGITAVTAQHGVNITNLHAVFKGGGDPLRNMMIYEVTIPQSVVLKDLRRDLEAAARRLSLKISIQHRRIFEAMNRI